MPGNDCELLKMATNEICLWKTPVIADPISAPAMLVWADPTSQSGHKNDLSRAFAPANISVQEPFKAIKKCSKERKKKLLGFEENTYKLHD